MWWWFFERRHSGYAYARFKSQCRIEQNVARTDDICGRND